MDRGQDAHTPAIQIYGRTRNVTTIVRTAVPQCFVALASPAQTDSNDVTSNNSSKTINISETFNRRAPYHHTTTTGLFGKCFHKIPNTQD
jgi:hypothetical protein